MSFEFATSRRILFGKGAIHNLKALADSLGQRILVVYAPASRGLEWVQTALGGNAAAIPVAVRGEPTVSGIREAVEICRQTHRDLVIGIGGGSALDSAKAIAALATNPGDVVDYLEVIGKNQPLSAPPLACIAIPTTAGTGSEVTRNAVIKSETEKVKVSLRSPLMLPSAAVIDPQLMVDVPAAITASTGMDALTQVLEPYVCLRANRMTDMTCREGLALAATALRRAYHHGEDIQAREDMAWVSLMGGLSLANAGLGAVHGFAAPIGGMFDAPHGAVCARLLPGVTAMNIAALQKRDPDSQVLMRYGEIARLLCRSEKATLDDLVGWLEELCGELEIPDLSAYGMTNNDISPLVEKAQIASSMKVNPVRLENEELVNILAEALG